MKEPTALVGDLPENFSCFIIGEGRLLVNCAEILLDQGHKICGILSKDPLVEEWAAGKGVNSLDIAGDLPSLLGGEPFDYLFSIVNYRILPDEVIALPRKATINYHDAPLPRYGGVNAVSWALINQEKTHGVTWHLVIARVDAGDILKQKAIEIESHETALSLNAKTYEAAIQSFSELVVELVSDRVQPGPQNPAERTFNLGNKRPAAACILSWNRPAGEIEAFVRAADFGPYLNPFSAVKLLLHGDLFIVSQVQVLGPSSQEAGTVVAIDADSITVAAADRNIAIRSAQSLAGELISVHDFIERYCLSVGYRFADIDPDQADRISALNKSVIKHEPFWIKRLEQLEPAVLPYAKKRLDFSKPPTYEKVAMPVPQEMRAYLAQFESPSEYLLAAFGAYLGRLNAGSEFDIGLALGAQEELGRPNPFARFVPFRLHVDLSQNIARAAQTAQEELARVKKRGTYLRDAIARHPNLRAGSALYDARRMDIAVEFAQDVRACQGMAGGTCTLVIASDGSEYLWICDPSVLSAEAVARIRGQFATFLRAIAISPEQSLQKLPLLSAEERNHLIVELNRTGDVAFTQRCIHEIFEDQAERRPEAPAVSFGGKRLTYCELNARANQLARYLQKQGIGPEKLVGLYVERSLDLAVGLLGILKAGGVYLPLDPIYPADRLGFMLEDSQASLLLTQEKLKGRLTGQGVQVVCLDQPGLFDQESGSDIEGVVRPDNLAYTIFTSGSTGRPKGVQICHGQVPDLVAALHPLIGAKETDTWTVFHSYAFDFSVWEIWGALLSGGCIVPVPSEATQSPEKLHALLAEERVTILNMTPSALSALLRYWREEKSPKSLALRALHVGGEALPREVAAAALEWGLPLWNFYGPTESTVWATVQRVYEDTLDQPIVSIGRPFAGRSIYLLDHRSESVPVCVAGELCIGGTGLARGYLARPDLSAEKFVPDPFSETQGDRVYRTGDLARYLPDGSVEFLGRIDHQVKVRGYRIELGEIESVLLSHESVREAVVVAREEKLGNSGIVAYVVGKEDPPTVAALRDHLRAKLPEYMVPSAFVALPALPISPNGKIDRKALPSPELSMVREQAVGPGTPLEEALVQIWREVLKRDEIGIYTHFFEAGGHSLLATQVLSRIRNRFGVDLPIPILFDSPTVAELASCVEAARKSGDNASLGIDHVPRDRPLPLSFAQRRLWYVHQIDPLNPAYNVLYMLRLTGTISVPALQNAVEGLIARHEILRSRYVEVDGVPMQEVCLEARTPFETILVGGATEEDRRKEALRIGQERTLAPFDLSCDPALRTVLFPISSTEHHLGLIMHHITSDGWTQALIAQELAALYSAAVENRADSLGVLSVQYADYASWQNQSMETPQMRQQLAYWKNQLAGAPQVSKLPLDRPRPKTRSLQGAVVGTEFDEGLTERLRALCGKEGCTLFMLLLACFNTMLYCTVDEEDVVVGTDTTGRNRTELEGLVGCFVNHVVLRTSLHGNPLFTELLSRSRRVALDAFAHQDVPFDRMVELLRPDRDPAYTPLFQILFVMQDVPTLSIHEGDLTLDVVDFEATTSKYDLSLFCHRVEQKGRDSVRLQWTYNTDIFDPPTIRQMADRFSTILSSVASNPEIRLSQIKSVLQEADATRMSQQQQRREAASYAKFQRIKPRSQN